MHWHIGSYTMQLTQDFTHPTAAMRQGRNKAGLRRGSAEVIILHRLQHASV